MLTAEEYQQAFQQIKKALAEHHHAEASRQMDRLYALLLPEEYDRCAELFFVRAEITEDPKRAMVRMLMNTYAN